LLDRNRKYEIFVSCGKLLSIFKKRRNQQIRYFARLKTVGNMNFALNEPFGDGIRIVRLSHKHQNEL